MDDDETGRAEIRGLMAEIFYRRGTLEMLNKSLWYGTLHLYYNITQRLMLLSGVHNLTWPS